MSKIQIRPIALQSILIAAQFEISKHPEKYSQYTKGKLLDCITWLLSIDWDYPECENIVIQEKPLWDENYRNSI